MIRCPLRSPLFPYTTLFRSSNADTVPAATAACAIRVRTSTICSSLEPLPSGLDANAVFTTGSPYSPAQCIRFIADRSEEHTSELQSRGHLVCRLLLEKKKYI